jgi:hypothetical protein
MRLTPLVPILCAGLFTSEAWAQAKLVPTDKIEGAKDTDVAEWNPSLGVTASIALTSNQSVVGQVDGFSTLFGLGLTGGADYVKGPHLLRSTLSVNENFARTPVIDELVKTNDVVKLEGVYNYVLSKNLGVYGRLSLSTSLFPADDVRGVATSWVEKDPDGAPIPRNQDALRQRLADPFAPFSVEESAGVFAEPLRKEKLSLSLRLGLGGRHTFASSVLLVADDAATADVVELSRLNDVHQLGVEAYAGASGKTSDGRAKYKAGLAILTPFVNNDADDRSAGGLTRVGFQGELTFNVYKWMGLVYSLNVTRDPQVFAKGDEKVQVQNNLLLSFQFTVVKKKEPPKKKTAAEIELEEAKARAEAAEKRAQEAEDRLKAQPATPPEPAPAPDAPPAPTPTP